MQLNDLELFIAVADYGSISSAATVLDMTPASASAALKRLEQQLGFVLFVRSTRRLRLTAEGERYLLNCRQALVLLKQGEQAVADQQGKIAGTLNITTSSDFGRNLLLPWLDELMDDYPELAIHLSLSDQLSDFFQDKVDIALRYGAPKDSNQVAFKICEFRRVLCASPAYIEHFGVPKTIHELAEHNCLFYQVGEKTHDLWRFEHQGQSLKIRVSGNRRCNDGEVARKWALAGRGIVFKSALDLASDLHARRVVKVLPAYRGEEVELYLVCPGREQVTPAVIVIRDMLRQKCKRVLQALASLNT
ncbi:LysR family transcriptional regulator [Shewanella gelidii]|uniref:LysR family transcriptional regulator n=1 Tax=Shewanella gelidii TaxID=1642821 RepID=UPI00166A1D48|nr:LysR family transcriptional regulator [Shewanella gelidii]MCL1098721.1 LysR family transcriptional regulator [Shewanella gelidii]